MSLGVTGSGPGRLLDIVGEEVTFKAYAPEQGELLPSHLAEALDPSDPVFFVSDVVESLELEAFEARYVVRGEHAYPPRLLLKLWLFGAMAGVYGGREIARRLHWDLRFRYLAGGLRPDFRTINRFRVRHQEDFRGVFRETVRLAQATGMVQLGRLAIDGSKVRANTSRHRAMSHGRMREAEARLEDEIGQILMQMEEVNQEEDEEHGEDDGSGGLPAELRDRKRRLERIRKARLQLEEEKGDGLQERHQKSFADPEANMMMTAEGRARLLLQQPDCSERGRHRRRKRGGHHGPRSRSVGAAAQGGRAQHGRVS